MDHEDRELYPQEDGEKVERVLIFCLGRADGAIPMEKLFTVPLKLNEMYLRGIAVPTADGIALEEGTSVSTDTYFGCFPCEPYAENTGITKILARAEVRGKGRILLLCQSHGSDKVLGVQEFNSCCSSVVSIPASLKKGCLYFRIDAYKNTEINGMWYESAAGVKETDIAIIICTYRREDNVLRNLELLSDTISKDELLRDHVQVFCVDNGGTLSEKEKSGAIPESVNLVHNRNYGGSGGYARGMLEALSNGLRKAEDADIPFTHFWLMDDDICFDVSILRRAITFLNHRKKDNVRLAAGMFPFENPTVQHEASAVFNGYTFCSNCGTLDFSDRRTLLKNRVGKQENSYGGWWSLIIPAPDPENSADIPSGRSVLPMPFFIKLDDVEYGLRFPGSYVVMNGFGVWHEAFGKKGNAWNEYYTTRNTLIIQAMYPGLRHSALKTMGIRLLKALAYGEPKCMEAAYRGAKDFSDGPKVFRRVDPERRHKEIMSRFGVSLRENMTRKVMLSSAAGNLLKPHNWKSIVLFGQACLLLKKKKRHRRYQADSKAWKEMSSAAFWREYLGLGTADNCEEQPLISVIIPVYNVAEYLPQCLESVCTQTYQNLEILLVDDGSTDGSGRICDEWKSRDSRINVIHKENGGVSSARNEGLKMSKGDFIGFVDSDDWIEADMYEKLMKIIGTSDAVTCGYMDYPYGDEDAPVPKGTKNLAPCSYPDAIIALFERNGYFTTLWSKLFRRSVVFRNEKYIPLDISLSFGEDEVWLCRVLKRCSSIAFVPEPLYHWRPRAGSVTRFKSISEKQLSLLRAKKIALKILSDEVLPERPDVIELAKSRMFNDCFLMKVQAYVTSDTESYKKISSALDPMKGSWWRSSDPPALRKMKVVIMELLMKIKAPKGLVSYLSGITRYSIR